MAMGAVCGRYVCESDSGVSGDSGGGSGQRDDVAGGRSGERDGVLAAAWLGSASAAIARTVGRGRRGDRGAAGQVCRCGDAGVNEHWRGPRAHRVRGLPALSVFATDASVPIGRVEMWRGDRRSGLSVGRPFRLAVPEYPRRSSVSTSPSSNRTCGFPASGSLPTHQRCWRDLPLREPEPKGRLRVARSIDWSSPSRPWRSAFREWPSRCAAGR